jgi:hypothetical protein
MIVQYGMVSLCISRNYRRTEERTPVSIVQRPLYRGKPPQPRAIATSPDNTVEERRFSAAFRQKYGHAERSESLP